MTSSIGTVATAQASKYLQQLCKHFAHKIPATWTETEGRISFPELGEVELAAEGDRLVITLSNDAEETLATLREVVVRHLERFAFRETLAVDWQEVSA